jgi:hypothetical protein
MEPIAKSFYNKFIFEQISNFHHNRRHIQSHLHHISAKPNNFKNGIDNNIAL